MGLVEYDSDSDSESSSKRDAALSTVESLRVQTDVKRKRTLPTLPSSYSTGIGPNDDPLLHQGRKRTRPYVEGDYDTHIYISLKLAGNLTRTLQDVIRRLNERFPTRVHSISERNGELHVSLAHPFPLRRSQIADFKADLNQSLISTAIGSFRLSLEGLIKVYYNGRRYGGEGHGGRAFFALKTTAGSSEIDKIVQKAIHPVLKALHRPLYHSDPEYHTSFAWCLTDDMEEKTSNDGEEVLDDTAEPASSLRGKAIDTGTLESLNGECKDDLLRAQPLGGWSIDKLILKIGKDTTELPFPHFR